MRARYSGRVLIDVKVGVEMGGELGPRTSQPLFVDLYLIPETLPEELCHQADHAIGRQCVTALDAFMDLQLKTRQRRHNEEVPVEVGHSLFDEGNLEVSIWIDPQQVVPNERL